MVRGAVIAGVERSRDKRLRYMSMSQKSYGIIVNEPIDYRIHGNYTNTNPFKKERVAEERFAWLIRRGDLILSDEPRVAEQEFTRTFDQNGSGVLNLEIYSYSEEEDDVPTRVANAQNGT